MDDIQSVFANASNPMDAFQTYVYGLSKVFGEGGDPLGSPIGTIAGETHTTSEPIRLACESTFKVGSPFMLRSFLRQAIASNNPQV